MLSVTRINEIRNIIQKNKSVLVSDLAKRYDVTEETIRRDLKQLEKEGILTRVYGGAYSLEGVQNDVTVRLRKNILSEEKDVIAGQCLRFINDGDSIFLDGSTTASSLANLILDRSLSVVTNSLMIAQVLSSSSSINLFLIGGKYNGNSMTFTGTTATETLKEYFVDKAFISCRNISPDKGLTDSDQEQALIRKTAIQNCNHSFLIADHTKLGHNSFYKVADLKEIDTFITNRPIDASWAQIMGKDRVEVIFP